MATAMEAELKEKQAMSLVSGLQADIEALKSQVRECACSGGPSTAARIRKV